MPTAPELMKLHDEALYIHTPRERLATVNDLARSPAPRFWLGRTGEGTLWRVRDNVPDAAISCRLD